MARRQVSGYRAAHNVELRVTGQSRFELVPPVLVLHLKRFDYAFDAATGASQPIKLKRFLPFPPVLRLNPLHIFAGPQGSTGRSFVLHSVLVHHGDSPRGGHYSAFVRVTDLRSDEGEEEEEEESESGARAEAKEESARGAAEADSQDEDEVTESAPVDEPRQTLGTARDALNDETLLRDQHWVHFDDQQAHDVSLAQVLKSQAYLLVYEQLDAGKGA
jgi:hypothetical protein